VSTRKEEGEGDGRSGEWWKERFNVGRFEGLNVNGRKRDFSSQKPLGEAEGSAQKARREEAVSLSSK